MALRDRNRATEAGFTIGALLFVLLPAILLVYTAHKADAPSGAIDANSATAEQFASAFGIDAEIAAHLVTHRTRLGRFDSVDQLWDALLLPPDEADSAEKHLEAAHTDPITASVGKLSADLAISQPAARRLAAYRDALVARTPGKPLAASWMRHASLLDPNTRSLLTPRIIVRSPASVFHTFGICAVLLVLLVLFVPPLLRGKLAVRGDPFIVPIALLVCGLGMAMLFSVKDPLRDHAVYSHHLMGIIIGVIVMAVAARLSTAARQRVRNYLYIWAIAAALLVVGLLVLGSGPEGVKLNLFGFQPVEIIKLLLVFFIAGYLSDRAALIGDTSPRWSAKLAEQQGARPPSLSLPRRQDLGPIAVMFALALALFYVIKDLGPGLLLFATFMSALYLCTGRSSFIWLGVLMILVGGVFGYVAHIGVFAIRADMWRAPFANTHPNGMQLGQSLWGVSSGGWFGSGLGLGMPGLIPRSGSDLAFASWVEETGIPGAWLLLALFAALVWRGVKIALRATNETDRALAFGLTALLGLQTLLIIGGVTGLFPLTGIALPFLSYGNSALVADLVLIGLLRGISSAGASESAHPEPRAEVVRAGHRFAAGFAIILFGAIGLYRLFPIQTWGADRIALQPIVTPDADGVRRPHVNPRLQSVADTIGRGSIYDRQNRVLATSRLTEIAHAGKNAEEAQRMAASRVRLYPFGAALAHLVGYTDAAVGGPFGFEKQYNSQLRGFDKFDDLLKDYRRRHIPGYIARRGRDLHLTLDADLQRRAQAILWKTATKLMDTKTHKPKDRGALVLLDPATGDVIVAASIPGFDPNGMTPARFAALARGEDAMLEHPLVDRAVDGWYPPGSTLKVATTASALANMPGALTFKVACNQIDKNIRWQAGGKTYAATIHDDKGDPSFGNLTLARGFQVSSNIYFANLAVAIGPEALRSTLADQLLFRRTPKQAAFDADLAEIGFGQGRMLASPLEMARLAATVAANGTLRPPRFAVSLTDPAGIDPPQLLSPGPERQAMRPPAAGTIQRLMRSVVTGGTASGVFNDLPFAVAGKTGTAQNHQFDHEPHSWFIGFAPYSTTEPPRYAFACVVENGGYGKRVAAVVCRDLLQAIVGK